MTLIVGSGSCGSTLLAQMLDNHPQVACGAELGLFSKPVFYDSFGTVKRYAALIRAHGVSSRPYFEDCSILRNLDHYPMDPDAVWKALAASGTFLEFVEGLERAILAATRKTIWIEKTPENIYLLKSIKAHFPNKKIIHIYRNPQDVVLSFIRRGHTVVSGSEVWLASLAALQSAGFTDAELLEVAYEDLVEFPSKCMQRICKFLNLTWDDAYISDSSHRSPGLLRSEGLVSWGLTPSGGISNHRVNIYKASQVDLSPMNNISLSPEFASFLGGRQWSMRELAAHYGYSFPWPEPKAGALREGSTPRPASSYLPPFSLYDLGPSINRILVGAG